MVLDYGLSICVAQVTGARPNRCWKNAWQSFIGLPRLFLEGTYVEGWAVYECGDEVRVLEHGWCALPGQEPRIVDPSIVLLIGRGQRVFYFSGLAYSWTEALAFEGLPLPRALEAPAGEADPVPAPYAAAYEQAMDRAASMAAAASPPRRVKVEAASPAPPEAVEEGQRVAYVVRIVPSSALCATSDWRAAARDERDPGD